jgi:hypothetical protein
MKAGLSRTNSPSDQKTSRARILTVAGYSVVTLGLLAFLTINGVSGIPTVATIGTASLVVIGILLPTAGMLQLRRSLGGVRSPAGYGYAMQAFGLIGLLFAVALVVVVSSLPGYIFSAIFVVTAGASAIMGAVLLGRHYARALTSEARVVVPLVFGTVLIFSGVGVIVGSNIAFYYLISQVQNTVYVDMGATVSACGCVLAAFSFFPLRNRS